MLTESEVKEKRMKSVRVQHVFPGEEGDKDKEKENKHVVREAQPTRTPVKGNHSACD